MSVVLDDTEAEFHSNGAEDDGDSIVIRDDDQGYVGVLNDVGAPGSVADVVSSNGDSFTLQYMESQGTIVLTDLITDNQYTVNDPTSPAVDVSHILVSTEIVFAAFRFCGLRKS